MAKRSGVLVVLIISAVVFAGCRPSGQPSGSVTVDEKTNSAPAVDLVKLETDYQSSLNEILAPYWQRNDVTGIKDKLLELTVPPKNLELHLALVLGIDMIEQGTASSDQEKVDAGKKKISDAVADFSWIKTE